MDLISQMIHTEPTYRISISEIISHPWMQGPTASAEEALEEHKSRMDAIQAQQQAQQNQA